MESVDSGPLNGLLVIDFSTLLPGPLAAQILAQAGARVIKIEKPETGDEMRSYEPRWGSISANFAMLNAGKESVSIDLKSADALELLRPLLSDADILLEQFRPGVMARLGLDYETVKRINPRLIYCSISGFGQTGPKSQVAGHDLNYIADTGLLDLSMGPPEARVLPPALVADIAAGAFPAVMNILLALQQRNATGTGCRLDIAMTDALFAFQYWNIGRMQATGESTISGAELVTGGSPRYNLYNTRDGRVVAAAPIEQKFWLGFCDAIGLEDELRHDERNPNATLRRVRELIAERESTYWEEKFSDANCCCNIVRRLDEALADPHFVARNLFQAKVREQGGQQMWALPLPLADAFCPRERPTSDVPSLGQHNAKIFGHD